MQATIYYTVFGCVILSLLFTTGSVRAQQNLFNVPTGRIPAPGEVFFQQQFNCLKQGISNTTINFGVWEEFEVGMNLLNVPFYAERGNFDFNSNSTPNVLLNLQQGFSIEESLHIGLGTQLGVSASDPLNVVDTSNFNWIVLEKAILDASFMYAGLYYANHAYLGTGTKTGILLGAEIALSDQFALLGDVFTGTSDISVAVLGGVYTFPATRWQFSLGYQLPFPHSGNGYGLVVELTRLPRSASFDRTARPVLRGETYEGS